MYSCFTLLNLLIFLLKYDSLEPLMGYAAFNFPLFYQLK